MASGCDGPAFNRLFTTDHFVYYVQDGATPPCDGTGEWLERYYDANAKFLGATLPTGERIEYYLVQFNEPLTKFGCLSDGGGMSGCTNGTTIHSNVQLLSHEVVHANASLLGNPPRLFKEGLAEVLGCWTTADTSGPIDLSVPIELLVESDVFTNWLSDKGFVIYGQSASFVRYLIDKFGSSPFLLFYAQAPEGGSRQEIDAVFRLFMGVTLDEAFADWRTRPASYDGDRCLRLMECDSGMPPLVDSDVTLGCPTSGDASQLEALRRFDVPKERTLYVTTEPVQAEPQIVPSVRFYRCSGGDAVGTWTLSSGIGVSADGQPQIDPAQPKRSFALNVAPGEYVAWFSGVGDASVRVDVTDRQSPMRDMPCQAADEPLPLSDTHPTTLASRWIERPCQGFWCPGQSWDVSVGATGGALEAQAIGVNNEANLWPSELYICSEPCPMDSSKCEVLALDTMNGRPVRSSQNFTPGTILHLGAPTAVFADHFAVMLRVAPE